MTSGLSNQKIAIFGSVCVSCFALAPIANGQVSSRDSSPIGAVLAVEANGTFVNLGHSDGVQTGSRLRLFHVIRVTHPVSKQTLIDEFPVGELVVQKSGTHVSQVSPSDSSVPMTILVGDKVQRITSTRPYVDPWRSMEETPETSPSKRSEPRDSAVSAVWRETLGKPPAERIKLWEQFLLDHPRTQYAGAIHSELQSLAQEEQRIAAIRSRQSGSEERKAATKLLSMEDVRVQNTNDASLLLPSYATAEHPLPITIVLIHPERIQEGSIHVRGPNRTTFKKLPLQKSGNLFQGEIPAALVVAPHLEYFISFGGDAPRLSESGFGSVELPLQISVEENIVARIPNRENRSRISARVEFVDFDGGGFDGFDHYTLAEVDFMYRFFKPVYAVRVGLGSLSGTGGPKDLIDSTNDCGASTGNYGCREISFAYSYAELEWRVSDLVAIMLRPMIGSAYEDRTPANSTEDRDYLSAFGLSASIRIGKEEETNLLLRAMANERFGSLFESALTWDVIPSFPIVLSAQVTNAPVTEDFGVRLIADVGWRKFDWIYPVLRVSYQARDIDHAGVSGGLGVNIDW